MADNQNKSPNDCITLDSSPENSICDREEAVAETHISSDEDDIIILNSPNANDLTEAPRTKEVPVEKASECITLDSDPDLPSHPSSPQTAPKPGTQPQVDFFNLESSDTDEEQQSFEKRVDDLLHSAAILNESECGPHQQSAENVSEGPSVPVPEMNLSEERNLNADTTHNVAKKFRRYTDEFKDSLDVNSDDDNKCEPYPPMYRRDERIPLDQMSSVSHIPRNISQKHVAHAKAITALSWCIDRYSHLLLSASADTTLKIWDIYHTKHVQYFKHNSALTAACWTLDGETVLTGGYGCQVHVYDVLSGKKYTSYNVQKAVHCITMHPTIEDVFLCGSENAIFAFDLRVNSHLPIRHFKSNCEEILDIAFLDENEFISSNSVVTRDSADRTIMAWHFGSGAILSNQIYLERYTCPSLKVHPTDASFVAQSNGNYIASFSARRPYKINNKIYNKHKVTGYKIECDISPDGKYLASGDLDGDVYFYDYFNTNLIQKFPVQTKVPVTRLKWHPVLSTTVAVSSWNGHLCILK